LAAAEKNLRFFIAFLNSPCYKTPKNAIKTNRAKQPREGGKKRRGEKKNIFVMSPDVFFSPRVFELLLLRNAQKRDKTKPTKKKKQTNKMK
jgi:hypothetical protein